jgi:uncharacterized damage-inducible protein DinB
MTIRDALLTELDLEVPFLRRTLERVPLDKRQWKPHDKSMTLGWLATFLAVMWTWGTTIIEQDEFDPAGLADGSQKPPDAADTAQLLQLFDTNVAAYRKALAGTTDEHLMKSWKLTMKGSLYFEQPRWLAMRTFIMNHAWHHRAQLGIYLRMNGIAVPAIYNDSADEKGGMFRE